MYSYILPKIFQNLYFSHIVADPSAVEEEVSNGSLTVIVIKGETLSVIVEKEVRRPGSSELISYFLFLACTLLPGRGFGDRARNERCRPKLQETGRDHHWSPPGCCQMTTEKYTIYTPFYFFFAKGSIYIYYNVQIQINPHLQLLAPEDLDQEVGPEQKFRNRQDFPVMTRQKEQD